MKKLLYILLCLCCVSSAFAKKKVKDTQPVQMTDEQQVFRYYFYDAQCAMEQDDYLRAWASYLFLVHKCPTDAASWQNLGSLCQSVGANDWALEYYQKAYLYDPEAYWANYASMLYDKQSKEALRVLKHSLKRMPDNKEVLGALASAYSAMASWKKAIHVQEKICYLDGAFTPYNTMPLYQLYVSDGQTKKALQLLDDYLEENPDDYRYQSFRGDVHLSLGDREQALRLYHEEEQRHPDNPYVLLSLADYSIRTADTTRCVDYIIKAIRSDAWEVEQKIRTLQTAGTWLARQEGLTERLLDELAQAYPLAEEVYEAQDRYYFMKGDYDKCEQVLRQLTELNPDNTKAWGRWLQVLQTDSAADEDFEYVIRNGYQHRANDPQWYYWMASLLLTTQNTDSALVVANEGVQHTAANADEARYRFLLLSMLGDLYMSRGELDSCYDAYEEALLLAPDNVYLLNNYAYTLAVNGGDLRKAERMSRKTIEKEPSNATYLDTYAWILHLQGQDFLAEFYIKQAMENQPDDFDDPTLQEHYDIILKK